MTAASTVAYPLMRELAEGWEHLYESATCAGICGDLAHQRRGGYHVGRAFQSTRNYSVVRVDDRNGMGPADAASAVDMSLSRKDMILCTKRLMAVWSNRADPRRKYINAFNGWLGFGAPVRCDMVSGSRGTATSDHRSHVHLELRRRYVGVRAAIVAVLSALRGDSVAQYLKQIGVKVAAAVPAVKTAGTGRTAPTPAPAPVVAGPKPPPYPGRILRRNDHQTRADPAVKTFQQRMLARGWKGIGVADGLFGERTENCVKRFQAQCRVAADGTIGPTTWPLPWTRPLGS